VSTGVGSSISKTSSRGPVPTPAEQQTRANLPEFLGAQHEQRCPSARVVSEEETETAGSIAVPAYYTSGTELDMSEGSTWTASQECGHRAHQAARAVRSLNTDAAVGAGGFGGDGKGGFGGDLVVAPGKIPSVPKGLRELEGLVLEPGDGGIAAEDWLDVTHAMLGALDDLGSRVEVRTAFHKTTTGYKRDSAAWWQYSSCLGCCIIVAQRTGSVPV